MAPDNHESSGSAPEQPKTSLPAFPEKQGASARPPQTGDMPLWVFLILVVLFVGGMLFSTLGSKDSLIAAGSVIVSDGLTAVLVFISAAGFGALLLRPLRLTDVPRALWLATSAGVGLWFFATLMLIVGSFIPGSLTQMVWWPIMAIGAVLAIAQARNALKSTVVPRRLGGGALVWWLVALAAGVMLAGLTLPPGFLGRTTADAYDILEYHLQLPREFLDAGRISTLEHNIYSHFPLSSEMLFLLGMCLRGSAYQAIYLCQMMNGLLAAVAVLAVFGLRGLPAAGLRKPDSLPTAAESDLHARFSTALLATSPWIIYLSYLAMEEMGQVAFVALALVWLKYWLTRPSWKACLLLGVLLGAACCFKYLSVGLVAGPVLAVMLVLSLRRWGTAIRSGPQLDGDLILLEVARRNWRRIVQWLAVAATALVVFSPWLIRNMASTGNPVFPLALDVFGHDGLTAEQAQRWENAHSPDYQPPVPTPPGWQSSPQMGQLGHVILYFLGVPFVTGDQGVPLIQPALGPVVALLLIATILAMLARPSGVGTWNWALLAILALQVAVWALFTRDMPGRFMAVAVPTICLLASGGLVRLAAVKEFRLLRQNVPSGSRWGTAPAIFLLVAGVALNLMSARSFLMFDLQRIWPQGPPPSGLPAQMVADQLWAGKGRLMLVGESRVFYFPSDTVYATVYNTHPLQKILAQARTSDEVAEGLGRLGVKNVWLALEEITRISYTIGWPEEMWPPRLEQAMAGFPRVSILPGAASRPSATQPGVIEQSISVVVLAVPSSAATMPASSGPTSRP